MKRGYSTSSAYAYHDSPAYSFDDDYDRASIGSYPHDMQLMHPQGPPPKRTAFTSHLGPGARPSPYAEPSSHYWPAAAATGGMPSLRAAPAVPAASWQGSAAPPQPTSSLAVYEEARRKAAPRASEHASGKARGDSTVAMADAWSTTTSTTTSTAHQTRKPPSLAPAAPKGGGGGGGPVPEAAVMAVVLPNERHPKISTRRLLTLGAEQAAEHLDRGDLAGTSGSDCLVELLGVLSEIVESPTFEPRWVLRLGGLERAFGPTVELEYWYALESQHEFRVGGTSVV